MKKLIFLTALFMLVTQARGSDLFKIGAKAGLAYTNVSIKDIAINATNPYNLVTGPGVAGGHIGLQTQFNVAIVVIKPELYFNTGGGTLERILNDSTSEALSVRFYRLDLPLLVGVKLGPVRINVGPVGSYVLSEDTKSEIQDIPEDYELFLEKKLTWGYQAGLGVDLGRRLTLDARYEGSLSKVGETLNLDTGPVTLDARPGQFIFSVGIWF